MKRILVVFGTRPEAVKMCPLILELRKRKEFKTTVCVTGQHKEMLNQVLRVFNVTPDYDLEIMQESQTLFDITTNILKKIPKVLKLEHPDMVLVHGDTTTTFAAALACFYMNIAVGHVEAGLRTYDIFSPFPEEFNRQAVGILSGIHFAPTAEAGKHLIQEGKKKSTVYITGNTVIDALKTTVSKEYFHSELEWAKGHRLILLTAHRRENLGKPMENMFRAIQRICREYSDIRVVYPVHMNPEVRQTAEKIFFGEEQVHMIEPLEVLDFHNFLYRSYLVLTDSGGIQEEASALGKPVLVMRDTTERPEGIKAGVLRLVGTEEEAIYRNFKELLEREEIYQKMSLADSPYGDGFASQKIADVLEDYWD